MQTIKDIINKIIWDKNLDKGEFSIFYLDRIENKKIEIEFNDIKRIEDNFIVIEKNDEEVQIPLHRIREVRKKGKLFWSRDINSQ